MQKLQIAPEIDINKIELFFNSRLNTNSRFYKAYKI